MNAQTRVQSNDVVCAIFVDKPNMTTSFNIAQPKLMDWYKVYQHMLENHVGESEVVHNVIYESLYDPDRQKDERQWFDGLKKRLGFQPLQLKLRTKRDIDSLIINDLWANVVSSLLRTTAQARHVKVIILSGDGDYLHVIDSIRGIFRSLLKLEIIIYSWKGSLSNGYYHLSDTCVEHLEDVHQ